MLLVETDFTAVMLAMSKAVVLGLKRTVSLSDEVNLTGKLSVTCSWEAASDSYPPCSIKPSDQTRYQLVLSPPVSTTYASAEFRFFKNSRTFFVVWSAAMAASCLATSCATNVCKSLNVVLRCEVDEGLKHGLGVVGGTRRIGFALHTGWGDDLLRERLRAGNRLVASRLHRRVERRL